MKKHSNGLVCQIICYFEIGRSIKEQFGFFFCFPCCPRAVSQDDLTIMWCTLCLYDPLSVFYSHVSGITDGFQASFRQIIDTLPDGRRYQCFWDYTALPRITVWVVQRHSSITEVNLQIIPVYNNNKIIHSKYLLDFDETSQWKMEQSALFCDNYCQLLPLLDQVESNLSAQRGLLSVQCLFGFCSLFREQIR